MNLTQEKDDDQDAFAFLGVDIEENKKDGTIELTQSGLINKILVTCGMTECNPKSTPASTVPLGTDIVGAPCYKQWDYASVVSMLMYLASNMQPDIQFAVHQCARFTRNPQHSHEQAI